MYKPKNLLLREYLEIEMYFYEYKTINSIVFNLGT